MFRKHITDLLSAYHEGLLTYEESSRVDRHLATCRACSRAFEEIRLGLSLSQYLPISGPPASMWDEISADLESTGITRGRTDAPPRYANYGGRRRIHVLRPVLAVALVILAALAALWLYPGFRSGSDAPVSLDAYLGAIESKPSEQRGAAISDSPAGFAAVDKQQALSAALLAHASDSGPLPGYRLTTQRIARLAGTRSVQLVYRRDGDVFSVFVAPEAVRYLFGDRLIQETALRGTVVRRVNSLFGSTVWFGAGGVHCVLVTQSMDPGMIEEIVDYFVSAHHSAG
ncbi:MAG: zf-HC2 domain-containing protein [Acidobacteria bacterium]|nr:zf-HC2 domain-containing protein [Acidobacteriota bacterium]